MRKFKLQIQTSVDGYMAGPNGEMDFMTAPWSEDLGAYVTALTEPVDTIVLGRKLAEGFIPHWTARPEYEPDAAIDNMVDTPKVVISETLTESPWDNTVVASDLVTAINDLKSQPGGDIIAYGGGTLVRDAIAAGLVDEIHLFVNPTVLGGGMAVFPNVGSTQRYRRAGAQAFECGVTVLHLEAARA